MAAGELAQAGADQQLAALGAAPPGIERGGDQPEPVAEGLDRDAGDLAGHPPDRRAPGQPSSMSATRLPSALHIGSEPSSSTSPPDAPIATRYAFYM